MVAGTRDARSALAFKLTVEDPNGATGSDDIEVIVTNIDHAPLANAGGNLTVNEGASVTLNGSASADPDGDALSFVWVQVAGPAVTLNDANTAWPQFTAPFVDLAGATLKFKLTVTDGFNTPSTDIATVTVTDLQSLPDVSHARPSVPVLWPPNHRMVPVSILGVIDSSGTTKITITEVLQDERTCERKAARHLRKEERNDAPSGDDGKDETDDDDKTDRNDDGDDANSDEVDAIINPDGTVLLRAERSGNSDGRVYKISFTASNIEGAASGTVKVVVPHSKKSKSVKDSGCKYDSTDGSSAATARAKHKRG
jgi:hypothetical protein